MQPIQVGFEAGKAVFLPQPIKHTLGGVPLLARDTAILFEPGVDGIGKTIQLRALDRRRSAVAWRN